MLSPEVWKFKPPTHNFSEYLGSSESYQKVEKEIRSHNFNHSVSNLLSILDNFSHRPIR